MARDVELKIGYQDHFTTVTRSIPEDEPPPWDADTLLHVVGKPVPRVDARDKVTGKAKYTHDIALPGMLYGVIVRSPYAAAEVRGVDTSAAEKMPGVHAVYVLDRNRVRFEGHELAAVAAETPEQAEDGPGRFVLIISQGLLLSPLPRLCGLMHRS